MESPDSSPTVRPSWPQKRDFAVLLTCPLLGPPTAAWSFTALAVLESAARSPDALAAFWRQIRVPDLFFIAVVSYGPMLPAALLGAATSSIAGLRIRSRLALLCLGPLFGAAAAALCLAALTLVAPDSV